MSGVIPNLSECRLGSVCRIVNEKVNNLEFNVATSNHNPENSDHPRTYSSPLDDQSVVVLKLEYSNHTQSCDPQNSGDTRVARRLSRHKSHDTTSHDHHLEDVTTANAPDRGGWDPGSAGLLRLFESSFFNMDFALQYLYNAKDLPMRKYLVNRLYDFPTTDVDFYLLQLVSLYKMSPELGKLLYPYFIYRCSHSAEFAIHVVWLLDTFDPSKRHPLRSTTSAMNRPASVPTFSHCSEVLPGADLNDGEREFAELMDSTMNDGSTLHDLRSLLLPAPEIILTLLNRSNYNPIYNSHRGSHELIPPGCAHDETALGLRNQPERSTLPKRSSEMTVLMKHKRTVSDFTSPVLSTNQTSRRPTGTDSPQPDERWLSLDSAVELNRECEQRLSTTKRSDPGSLAPLSGSLSRVDLVATSQPDSSNLKSFFHKNVTHSLQHFASTEPSTANENADDTTKSSSISPPDSGLQLTAHESDDHHEVPGKLEPPPDSPIVRLQLHLVPRMVPEWDFVDSLLRLGRRLTPITSKEQRTACLQAELANLNLHLPARVWLPVYKTNHIVLRIPPTAAVCLNSKDKAPYLIYLEVLACDDRWSVAIPCRSSNRSISKLHSSPHHVSTTTSGSYASLANGPWDSTTPSSNSPVQPGDSASVISDQLSDENAPSRPASPSIGTVDGTTPVTACSDLFQSPLRPPRYVAAGEIRNRLKQQVDHQPHRSFKSDPEDPSAAVLKEPWQLKCQRIRDLSPWGHLAGWHLTAAIVKVGDDLRQEQLAYQLLSLLQRIWHSEYVRLWLRPLTVIVTSADSGLIEPVPDTVSLHQIRRHARLSLLDYFLREHGPMTSEAFLNAQRNFVESCAAYCLVSYLLQVKDRHNGNILIDNEGHVIHIDYGFMLSASPGKNLGFEMSPFKLTMEQVAVMGGLGSDMFEYFKCLLLRGLLVARKYMNEICVLVEISRSTCPQLPCFSRSGGHAAISGLRQRFHMSRTEEQLGLLVDRMVENALNSVTTRLYDSFQYYTNGIQ